MSTPTRWPTPRWLAVAGLAAATAGCASASDEAAAVARGQVLASQYCGGCHGLGQGGESSFPGAAPFRTLNFDVNAINYQRSMAAWHLGHSAMPPAQITPEGLDDLDAYVRSLKRNGGR